jgi:hypothetical protein
MAKKAAKQTQSSNARSTEDNAKSRITRAAKPDNDQGAPIEHFHGEKNAKHVGDPGDLDEETLNENAPYNKTYGRGDK